MSQAMSRSSFGTPIVCSATVSNLKRSGSKYNDVTSTFITIWAGCLDSDFALIISSPILYRTYCAGRVSTGLFDVREGITVKNGITYLRRQPPGSDCSLRGAAQAVCPLIPFTSLLLWLVLGVGLNVGQSMSLEQDHHWNPGFFT
ncbi:hypothetical protein BJV77DRAFT_122783 [Russula vinacea]|nr:hypothetical protein BJV77DRAFT_122783 [Russula vinacea]